MYCFINIVDRAAAQVPVHFIYSHVAVCVVCREQVAPQDPDTDDGGDPEDDTFSPEVAALLPPRRDRRRGSSVSVSSHVSRRSSVPVGNSGLDQVSSAHSSNARLSAPIMGSTSAQSTPRFSPQIGSARDIPFSNSVATPRTIVGSPVPSPPATPAPALLPPPRNYLKLSQQSMNKPPRPLHAQSRKRKRDDSPGGLTHLLHNPLFGHPDHVASHFPSLDFCDDLEPVDSNNTHGGDIVLSSVPLVTHGAAASYPPPPHGSASNGVTSGGAVVPPPPSSARLPPLSLNNVVTVTPAPQSISSTSLLASSHLAQRLQPLRNSPTKEIGASSSHVSDSVDGMSVSETTSFGVQLPTIVGVPTHGATPPLSMPFSTDAQSVAGSTSIALLESAPCAFDSSTLAQLATVNASHPSVDTPPVPPHQVSDISEHSMPIAYNFMTPDRARAYEALYELSPNFESPPRYVLSVLN